MKPDIKKILKLNFPTHLFIILQVHINIMDNTLLSETIFRQEEKKYKRPMGKRKNPNFVPDLENIIDLQNQTSKLIPLNNKVYTFPTIPGLFFLPNYLSKDEQMYWVRETLNEYTKSPPYSNNIVSLDPTQTTNQYSKDIRWSRLGQSYSWHTTSYDEKNSSPFPQNLETKIKQIVSEIEKVDTICENVVYENYQPQVAFVNYYLLGSTMMAHQDKSEKTFDRPLISVSLGCSAIFLIGTDDRNDKPYAFILRSGDAIAMTGKSRLAYHGVPRIIDDCPQDLIDYNEKIASLRININVRQVE